VMVVIVAVGVVLSALWLRRQERQRALESQMANSAD
jgi:Flp pilus assembly protein TadB